MVVQIKTRVRRTFRFLLYGVVFALVASVASSFTSGHYTHTPPVAHADHPSGDGGPQDGAADAGNGGASGGNDSAGAGW